MNLLTDNYFEMLSDVQDAIKARIEAAHAITLLPLTETTMFEGGVSYGVTKHETIHLHRIKGAITKKAAHAVVYRMESGKYELTFYIA